MKIHSRNHRAPLALLCAAVLLAAFPSLVRAADTHLFDATLSLTGDCSTSTLDPIPDPGCPGGTHPPSGAFTVPSGEATDEYGNLYVASWSSSGEFGADGRVDVFASDGSFITEIPVQGPMNLAVDSLGHLYILSSPVTGAVVQVYRFDPTIYNPAAGKMSYTQPPTVIVSEPVVRERTSVAVDRSNDHLYVGFRDHINEYGSAEEGNPLLDATIGMGSLNWSAWIAIDGSNHDVYVSDTKGDQFDTQVFKVFDGQAPEHSLKLTIDGSNSPIGEFKGKYGYGSLAIDESSGNIFLDDRGTPAVRKPIYEFTKAGDYVATIEHKFVLAPIILKTQIAVDNGSFSPNKGTLFVPSGESNADHIFAFKPVIEAKAPVVGSLSLSGTTDTEAELRAEINPNGSATHYTFEFTTQQSFEEQGFGTSTLVSEGDLPNGTEGIVVVAPLSGLSPDSRYRYRVVAENNCGSANCRGEAEMEFGTFRAPAPSVDCDNQTLRTGASAALPDCRAYELVTPSSTAGHAPRTVGNGVGPKFAAPTVSPRGDSVSFLIEGGLLPGTEGSGGLQGDGYLSTRSPSGWQTVLDGPTSVQSAVSFPGGHSPDLGYSAWGVRFAGELPLEGQYTDYLRYPDGSFHLVARGSLGASPRGQVRMISEDGGHVIFTTRVETSSGDFATQLEPNAPPDGTGAIYDRTGEVTHVVSLLPGELTPGAGEDATIAGGSSDGSAIAFEVGSASPLYLRVDNAETLVAAPADATFAGLSADGRFLFYLAGNDLFRFDAQTGETVQITDTADATVVNVPSSGNGAYFTSPSGLTSEPNPNGDEAQVGQENLYFWDGLSTRLVGTVTERDVKGISGSYTVDGLGLWTTGINLLDGQGVTVAVDPSRTSNDGATLLFASRANLTGQSSSSRVHIYRYDADEDMLGCISCSPIQAPATTDASLQTTGLQFFASEPVTQYSLIPNLSTDGRRAFFESSEALVLADTDGVKDVYEWEASGVGGCTDAAGCVYLISSGRSARDSHLFGVSASGDDVFIRTSDLLVAGDGDETPSIYDARVGGGFPPAAGSAAECLGEACQPAVRAPNDPTPASLSFQGAGNVGSKARLRCPKGKHPVRKAGRKGRCVRPQQKKSGRQAGTKRRAAR